MDSIAPTAPRPFVFVLMPFDKAFDDVYQLGIKEAANAAGAHCERVDEQIFDEAIIERVYNQIAKADLIISEMTGRNPNVFYETGYAHALGKRVILLTQRAEDIPFDLKHFPHVVYGGRIAELRKQVEQRVRWAVDNPAASLTTIEPFLEFFHDGQPLSNQVITAKHSEENKKYGGYGTHADVELSVHNAGSLTYRAEIARMGLILPVELEGIYVSGSKSVTLPDRSKLFILDDLESIFPDAWDKVNLYFRGNSKGPFPAEYPIRLRIYSEVTTREIPFTLRIEE